MTFTRRSHRRAALRGASRIRLEHLEDRVVPSLVAAFGFNEGTGATAVDASGLGNNGLLSGAACSASGKFGGAVSFDGVNDLVTVADAASLT